MQGLDSQNSLSLRQQSGANDKLLRSLGWEARAAGGRGQSYPYFSLTLQSTENKNSKKKRETLTVGLLHT
jgi:hypothetical protein